jgi:hypothetical protein
MALNSGIHLDHVLLMSIGPAREDHYQELKRKRFHLPESG